MRRFPSTELPRSDRMVFLDRETSHHLLRVVGIAPLEQIELFDGKGSGCIAHLVDVVDGLARVAWVVNLSEKAERPRLTLVLALTKGDAFETALRMCTEMGVDAFIPLQAQRSISKGDKSERWLKIVTAAAGQSKRLNIPSIAPLQTWKSIWDALPAAQTFVLHPTSNEVQPLQSIQTETTVFIGPEGGFTDQEMQWFEVQGVEHRSLGSLVLKADTAAIVSAAIALQGL